MTLTQVTLVWHDATQHGSGQYDREDFTDGRETQLSPGVAVGWLLHETPQAITLAMDYFDMGKHGPPWRMCCSYPKTGIARVIRRRVRLNITSIVEAALAKKKMAKATVKKAHKIAERIKSRGKSARNAFAIGMSVAKKQAAKRKRKRAR